MVVASYNQYLSLDELPERIVRYRSIWLPFSSQQSAGTAACVPPNYPSGSDLQATALSTFSVPNGCLAQPLVPSRQVQFVGVPILRQFAAMPLADHRRGLRRGSSRYPASKGISHDV